MSYLFVFDKFIFLMCALLILLNFIRYMMYSLLICNAISVECSTFQVCEDPHLSERRIEHQILSERQAVKFQTISIKLAPDRHVHYLI